MESSGTTPTGSQSPAAIPDIAVAFDGPGPFVTVYLGTEAAVEQAAQQSELRWKTLRRQLEEGGAPAQALAAIDPLVPDAHHRGRTLAVVADASGTPAEIRCCASRTPVAGHSGVTRHGPRTSGSTTPRRWPTTSPRWPTTSVPASSWWPATSGRSSC